jgi:hypothetical protein
MRALTFDELSAVSGGETIIVPATRRPPMADTPSNLRIIQCDGDCFFVGVAFEEIAAALCTGPGLAAVEDFLEEGLPLAGAVAGAWVGSTGGAVGGRIVGGTLGTVAGGGAGTLVAPGPGTVVGGIVGGAAGAGIGRAVGATAGRTSGTVIGGASGAVAGRMAKYGWLAACNAAGH